ncbi:hypothetical protein SAMN04487972_11356 [Paracoccus halophilus]|uniref:Alcohol dehydrogenase n=1 Tax=Paracoccus halophilus TaxID=376733 RepID=A0A099F1L1_9RHOB|nr:iron-containing alcohol dehydrogenase [Paracoccus halophilus]KGJ04349.1 alcohol dehydrogenase [Paracoccus halophilus]SFA55200.1 hypothetical protein SAMN04487972_11356 [Paracoccus halophilus]
MTVPPFQFALPGCVVFGRNQAARAPAEALAHGARGVLVHGADGARAEWLARALRDGGARLRMVACGAEPTLPMLEAALADLRDSDAQWVLALGGGAALDMGKALAALIPAPGGIMDHLEVVGRGLPLTAAPLPFIALPTTAGTGAEATRNAVIGLPDHGRKASIRDPRMLPRLAIVDPALTDGCPRGVTLASGLDALAQVIEPYLSCKATPFTDALVRPAIGPGLRALMRLMQAEDAAARDCMAWVSLCGGMALANGGLGAVHGLAGVIGGVTPAAHGAICGALLGPVLRMNRDHAPDPARAHEVCREIALALDCAESEAPQALARWARDAGLPGLGAQGLAPGRFAAVAEASLGSSSMKGNPFLPDAALLCEVLEAASPG